MLINVASITIGPVSRSRLRLPRLARTAVWELETVMTPTPVSVASRPFPSHRRDKSSFRQAATMTRTGTAVAALLLLAACSTGVETSDAASRDDNAGGTNAN